MRYKIQNLKELKKIMRELDDGDRIGFIVYGDNPIPHVTEYCFRFSNKGIIFHEIKEYNS